MPRILSRSHCMQRQCGQFRRRAVSARCMLLRARCWAVLRIDAWLRVAWLTNCASLRRWSVPLLQRCVVAPWQHCAVAALQRCNQRCNFAALRRCSVATWQRCMCGSLQCFDYVQPLHARGLQSGAYTVAFALRVEGPNRTWTTVRVSACLRAHACLCAGACACARERACHATCNVQCATALCVGLRRLRPG